MGTKEEEFRANMATAMNVRANLAYSIAGKANNILELERLANWVLNGMAAQQSVNDEIDRANKELDANLGGRLINTRPYTKKPGVKYGRASWAKSKPAKKTTKRKYTKRNKAFWGK